ncbi:MULTISPECIES: PA2928 family protein [Pseudomonas aeruginosa group]|nr:PA2928 family protein [Pseudomonas aeruginosa]
MDKGAKLFAVFWVVLGLGLVVGLPVGIHFILGQYDDARFSGPQLAFEEQGRAYLAFTLDEYRADEVDNGVVHGSSRVYAQVVDLAEGRLRWSTRLDADNARGDDWGAGELLGQSSRYLFYLRNALYVLDRRSGEPVLAFDELERRTGGLPLKSAPWGKDAYRYDEGRGGLLMLALDGRVWFLDGDSLALREAPEVDAARYFHGDPPAPAGSGIAWQAPGLARLPDGRLLVFASDHEARALERGEALPAANERLRRQRLQLGTLDWRSPAGNRLAPLLDTAFLRAGLLPDPDSAEAAAKLFDEPAERERQRPHLPPEPQPPAEFDERLERFPGPRAFLAARDAYRQERRRWIAAHEAWRDRVAALEAAADAEYRRRRDEQAREQALYRRYAQALPGGASGLARRPWQVDGNWLVVHRRSLAERSELLLSSVSVGGHLNWTLELPVEYPERLFRLDGENLLLSGRAEDGGRVLRVDLRRGAGVAHRLARGAGAPLRRIEWPEARP